MSTVADVDREARFTALAREVGPALRRYVVRRAAPGQVDDVLADTMLVLWRRLDDVPGDDPLPWSYAVARGCLQNTARSAVRQRRLAERLAAVPEAPAPAPDPDLAAALGALREEDRELIRLWAWEDLAPREIAVVLGISANAVSIRLHRAKQRLAELLTQERKSAAGSGQEPGEGRRT